MGEGKIIWQSSAIGVGGSKMRVVQQQGRSRRLGICHHTGSILPAPLRLLQDLAKVGGVASSSSTIPSAKKHIKTNIMKHDVSKVCIFFTLNIFLISKL